MSDKTNQVNPVIDIEYGWVEPISTYSEGITGNSHCIVIGNELGTITRKATRHPDGSIEYATVYSNEDVYNDAQPKRSTL